MTRGEPRLQAYAAAAPGFEPWLARELRSIGLAATEVEGGASFDGPIEGVYRANLLSRLASRVVVRLAEFRVRALGELARRTGAVPWEEWIPVGATLRIRASARKSRLYHTGAIAERVVEGVGRRVRVDTGSVAPDEDGERPPVSDDGFLLLVRLAHDTCTISLDSSGTLLHRRGYRQAVAKAPVRETLAAAMLVSGGWRAADGLVDPFCGSGTIAIEAALVAREIAPGIARAFAFERWPRHDAGRWSALRDEARSRARTTAPAPILASDRDEGAVGAALDNARRAGVEADIQFSRAPLSAAPLGPDAAWIVTNPPYGVRVGEAAGLRDLYASLGRILRERRRPLVMLSADTALERQLGIRLETVLATRNGGIPVRVRRAAPVGGDS
jgi:putative N6-adenine-specific DNA methylase